MMERQIKRVSFFMLVGLRGYGNAGVSKAGVKLHGLNSGRGPEGIREIFLYRKRVAQTGNSLVIGVRNRERYLWCGTPSVSSHQGDFDGKRGCRLKPNLGRGEF